MTGRHAGLRRREFSIGWQGTAIAAAVPVNSVAPVASGALTVGSILSVTDGTWTNSPTGYAYQWKRDATNVGTNANTYTLVTADIGAMLSCAVTASNAGGAGVEAASNALGPIVAVAVGGAALLVGETDGLGIDFTYATDAGRVAVKTAGVVVSQGLDTFFTNAGTSPKMVFDVTGALVWSPHNMFLNSAAPVTQSVTTVVGQNYTVTVVGSGSMTGSAGASGVATAGAPLTYTATTTTSTFTKAGTLTQIQMNRGAVATAHLPTTGTIRNGVAVDYDPTTHVCKGFLCEGLATNFLLNTTVPLVTQNVATSATPYTLTFLGTGTITLSGTSTAGPLVGTGANNRVSLAFTPTAGTLTLTVTGTASNAQLEQCSAGISTTTPTSFIPTFGATVTRAVDTVSFSLSSIPAIGSDYSLYGRLAATPAALAASRYAFSLHDGTATEMAGVFASPSALQLRITDNSVLQAGLPQGTHIAGTMQSIAGRVKLNDCAASVAGAAVVTDVAATLPTVTTVNFANNGGGGTGDRTFNIEKMAIVMPGWNNATLATKSAT
jgi:hypothetical protein